MNHGSDKFRTRNRPRADPRKLQGRTARKRPPARAVFEANCAEPGATDLQNAVEPLSTRAAAPFRQTNTRKTNAILQ